MDRGWFDRCRYEGSEADGDRPNGHCGSGEEAEESREDRYNIGRTCQGREEGREERGKERGEEGREERGEEGGEKIK